MVVRTVAARPLVAGLALVAAMLASSVGHATAGAAAPAAGTALVVGEQTLAPCHLGAGRATPRTTWCGRLSVPLDPADPSGAAITVGYGWLPAAHPAVGTVVAQEGGPGYPSTGTVGDFVTMLGPLLRDHNLLVVDARGTGRSTAIDCRPLQTLPQPPAPVALGAAVAACGRQLDSTWRDSQGAYVHASDLFTTAASVGDLARVLTALRVGPVEFYGDSYGTYFGQSFLARFPQLVSAAVLDSAYEARDLDPWYRTTVSTARRSFDVVCERSPACVRATGPAAGQSWQRIGQLVGLLRSAAIQGRTGGRALTFDVTALVNVVNDAGYDYGPYRRLDAAVRAYLEYRDPQPLLELYARDIAVDYGDYTIPSTQYSDGLYLAVSCTDSPQLFDMSADPAGRRRQLATDTAELPAGTFAPFTTAEWLTVNPYTENYTACLSWPRPVHVASPPVPVGAAIDPGHAPVLILNGELDSLTPAAGGLHISRQIGADARAVVAANMVHLVGLVDPYGCGQSLVRRFLGKPRDLAGLDTSCTASIPPVHTVGHYPQP